MDYNWLGVSHVSDDLPCEIEEMVEQKMEELKEDAEKKFLDFLDRNRLEMAMGVIIRKRSLNDFVGRAEKEKIKKVIIKRKGWKAEVFCPTCGVKLGTDPDWASNQTEKCPECGQKFKRYH